MRYFTEQTIHRNDVCGERTYTTRHEFASMYALMEWTVQATEYFKSEVRYEASIRNVIIEINLGHEVHTLDIRRGVGRFGSPIAEMTETVTEHA